MARSISAGKHSKRRRHRRSSKHRRHRRSSKHRRSKHHRRHRRRSSRRRGSLINKGFGLGARSVSAVGQGLAGTARLLPVVGSTTGNFVVDVGNLGARSVRDVGNFTGDAAGILTSPLRRLFGRSRRKRHRSRHRGHKRSTHSRKRRRRRR